MDVRAELERRGLRLRDSGHRDGYDYAMTTCLFHDDNNPSMSVNLTTGGYKCFAGQCGEQGSFVDLIAHLDGVDYGEARRRVRTGDDLEGFLESVWEGLAPKDPGGLKYYSWQSFHQAFPDLTDDALAYLEQRDISGKTASTFQLRTGRKGKWAGRIIIPIQTPAGKLLSYAGRAMRPGTQPKTRKSRSPHSTLFGIELIDGPFLVVTEGEFDAMYLSQYGIPAVANMGTMLPTSEKLEILRCFRRVTIAFDGDDAGRTAAAKYRDRVATYTAAEAIALPEGKDPNEMTGEEVESVFSDFQADRDFDV